jgi:hypothetical protein
LTVSGTQTTTVGGNVTFGSQAAFQVNFSGASASLLNASGAVTIGSNALLNLNADASFNPTAGKSFIILENTGALSGQFANHPEGSTVTLNGHTFVIHYVSDPTGDPAVELAPSSQAITVATTTTLVASAGIVGPNRPVTFTATIASSPPGTSILGGAVQFFIDGSPTPFDTESLQNGSATSAGIMLALGTHQVTADYGTSNPLIKGSVSPPLGLTVQAFQPLPKDLFVVGADAGGGPEVKVFDAVSKAVVLDFFPFSPAFTGGVRVAVGDINGDGYPDIICAAGPGGGPDVVVFSGKDGSVLRNFFAFGEDFTGGVYLAAGDVNGDGYADIICGADAGGGPDITVYSGKDGSRLMNFFAYGQGFTGGVRIAAADVNGDGYADIICGAGPGGGPNVTVYSGKDGSRLYSFFAFAPTFSNGIFVAGGDVNGDGHADIIAGAGPGGGPDVRVFSGLDGLPLSNFFPYDPAFTGGVRVR